MLKKNMADTREESSEESSDSTSSDNFSIYTETNSSEQDLPNLPGRLLHQRQRIIHAKGIKSKPSSK